MHIYALCGGGSERVVGQLSTPGGASGASTWQSRARIYRARASSTLLPNLPKMHGRRQQEPVAFSLVTRDAKGGGCSLRACRSTAISLPFFIVDNYVDNCGQNM